MNEDRVPYLQLVTTIREKCRRCYTCVRECPAKAIQIEDGQASVIQTRCIGCGNCVTVCSQNAKQVLSGIEATEDLLAGDAPVAAIVAPSYPAEFTECSTAGLVGALRELGFASVHEVSFGADLVAAEYVRLLEQDDGRHIATTCPAVVSYVRKYHPDILDRLAPIVSPMLAIARVLHKKYGPELRIVFIGPCIAKKGEARYEQFEGEVHAALTYVELRALLAARGVSLTSRDRADDDFDPPHGSLGALFPITRGMLQAADLDEDLLSGDIVSADGRQNLVDAITDFEHGDTEARLLDILCCEGCIMGAGFSCEEPVFKRRSDVSAETRARQAGFDQDGLGGRRRRVRRHRPLAHLRALRPALRRHADAGGAPGDPRAHEQVRRRGRARLRGLRLRHLPRTTRWPSGRAWPRSRCACPTPSRSCARRSTSCSSPTSPWRRPRRRWSRARSSPAWASSPPASPTRSTTRWASSCCTPTCCSRTARTTRRRPSDVKLIVDQANRCKKIISGLLNFARQSRVVRQPTDLTNLVAEVCAPSPSPRASRWRSSTTSTTPSPSSTATRSSRCSPTCSPTPSTPCPTAAPSRSRSTAPRRTSSSPCRTRASASPRRTSTSCSARSSRPSRSARARASASPSRTASSRCTAARSPWSPTPIPPRAPPAPRSASPCPRYEAETDVPASLQEITGS